MEDKNFEYVGGSLYRFTVNTTEKTQMINITEAVDEIVEFSGVSSGLCQVFVPHTTAGVTINENADPNVASDLMYAIDKLIADDSAFRHAEGNSAAHLKSSVIGASEQLIVRNRKLLLGTWQGIYLFEFDGSRERTVYVKMMG